MGQVRYVDFHPDEWLAGTVRLTLAERGLYITACSLMYSNGGPIEVDHLKETCRGDHGRTFNFALKRLLDLGKLVLNGTEIANKRVLNELENASKRVRNARENGAKGGRPNGLAKPSGLEPPTSNHQPSTKESSLRSDSARVRARDPSDVVVDLTKAVSKMSPVEKLYLGGYRAAQNVIRDLGLVEDGPASDVPLLDG